MKILVLTIETCSQCPYCYPDSGAYHCIKLGEEIKAPLNGILTDCRLPGGSAIQVAAILHGESYRAARRAYGS